MNEPERNLNENEVLPRDDEIVSVRRGTVGWASADKHYDLGTGDNEGVTLVRVTLYAGRQRGTPISQGVADGHEIWVQVGGPLWAVPPKGQTVLVAFPDNDVSSVGSGVIVAWLGKSPSQQFNGTRAMLDVGIGLDLVIKGKSVTLGDYGDASDGVHPRWLCIGPPPSGGAPGIVFQDETGSGGIIQRGTVAWFAATGGDAKTLLQLTATEWRAIQKAASGASYVALKDGNAQSFGAANQVIGGGVYLGRAPTVANTALWGVTGVAGTASTSVFLSV